MSLGKGRMGISRAAYLVTVVVLLAVAGGGYGLYFNSVTSVTTTTTIATTTTTLPARQRIGVVGGFLNGKIVAFEFYTPFKCEPSVSQIFQNQKEAQDAAKVTTCEVGAPGKFPNNAVPVWGLVPAFAGLSIFGVPDFGAAPEGFPTYNGKVILTDCTGMGSKRPCPDHPPLVFSPMFLTVQKFLNITSGVMGLPEGVMPFPAHTHIVDTDAGQQDIPWNAIAVFVFDPNILPNPATGRCEETVLSSLSNPTGNCLTSTHALQRAMTTTNSAIADANAKNPIWLAIGKPLTQVVVAGASDPSQYRNANSNVDVPFVVKEYNPYPPYP